MMTCEPLSLQLFHFLFYIYIYSAGPMV